MLAQDDLILPMILCGGSGTRLWPASRESLPKQFITLAGERSTFQEAALRVADPGLFAPPLVLTAHEFRFVAAEQIQEAGLHARILLEPVRRDTAAAVAVAALCGERIRPDALVLVLPADHAVGDAPAFRDACRRAAEAARRGLIMTLGLTPTGPSCAYGYIRPGEPVPGTDALAVAGFAEKPDPATAAAYLAEGRLWNGGYLLFRADAMLAELAAHAPGVLEAARAALALAQTDLDFVRLDAGALGRAPTLSIDYAVMERTSRAGVLPVTFPWSDVGTWDAVWELSPRDGDGNALAGAVEALGTRNSLVRSEGLLTTVVGLDDAIVVATPDAVLVASRRDAGRVREAVAALRLKNRPEADEHLRSYRPWGWHQRIDRGPRFQCKRIVVKPGGRLSLQKHHHRAEHWVVVHGTAEVTLDGRVTTVHENEGVYIPIGSVHRLANPGRIPLELIEVQVGSYSGEDDIVRIEDAYGR